MTTVRTTLAATALLLGLLFVGCATKVELADTDPSFADGLAAAGIVGLGDVTVAPQVGGVLAPDDAVDAGEAFYRAFLGNRPDLVIWPRPTVVLHAGEAPLAELAAQYGRYGRLRADHLETLAAPLEDCRYLALARLTEDVTRSHSQRQDTMNPEARVDGVPEHDSAWSNTVTTERTIKITMEIFDLATRTSVWKAEAESSDRQRYAYEEVLERDGTTYLKDRLAADGDAAVIPRRGQSLDSPDLIDLMEQALGELVQRLPGRAS